MKNYDWYLCCYASTIIHEATHGYLMSRSISYNARNRARSERLCHNEQNHFLKKLDYKFASRLITEFNEKHWHDSWYSGRWERLKMMLKRIQAAEMNCRNKQKEDTKISNIKINARHHK